MAVGPGFGSNVVPALLFSPIFSRYAVPLLRNLSAGIGSTSIPGMAAKDVIDLQPSTP